MKWESPRSSRIVLKRTLKSVLKCGLDSTGSGEGPVTDYCKYSNGTSDSIRGKFIDYLSYYQLLKDSVP
jgi:hypothetical protein